MLHVSVAAFKVESIGKGLDGRFHQATPGPNVGTQHHERSRTGT